MRSTIQDVANLAKVSTATVSNVVTQNKYVSPELEKKVKDAMRELNYTTNPIARSLKINKTNMIGLIVPDISNPFFSEIIKTAQQTAEEQDYQLILYNSNGKIERERAMLKTLYTHGVDGILNVAPRMLAEEFENYDDVPMVIVDRPSFQTKCEIGFVYSDNELGGEMAAKRFVGMGFKKFTCLAGPVKKVVNANSRLSGFYKTILQSGFSKGDISVHYCDFTFYSGFETMADILSKSDQPNQQQAVFVSSDIMAWGAIEAIKKCGFSVPNDFCVIGYDNIFYSKFIEAGLTTIENPSSDIAIKAVNMLVAAMSGKYDIRGKEEVLPSPLILRNTC